MTPNRNYPNFNKLYARAAEYLRIHPNHGILTQLLEQFRITHRLTPSQCKVIQDILDDAVNDIN